MNSPAANAAPIKGPMIGTNAYPQSDVPLFFDGQNLIGRSADLNLELG